MWEYSSTAGLGEQTVDDINAGAIYVHGMNKKWVYNEEDGTAGTLEPVDNFINGYLANISHINKRCWAQTCKNHANKAY
jgi:hypothetical protein